MNLCKEFKAAEFFAGQGEVSKALRALPVDDEDQNDVAQDPKTNSSAISTAIIIQLGQIPIASLALVTVVRQVQMLRICCINGAMPFSSVPPFLFCR